MLKDIILDLNAVYGNKVAVFLGNRGFHALVFYRLSNFLYKCHVPIIPLLLTRFIQIIYGIDIDYRAKIDGGCAIYHGIGLVIGHGVKIGENVTLFHGVTLGKSFSGSKNDGFPTLGNNVMVGAGAKILGNLIIGDNVKIGANSVVVRDIPSNCTAIGIPATLSNNRKYQHS